MELVLPSCLPSYLPSFLPGFLASFLPALQLHMHSLGPGGALLAGHPQFLEDAEMLLSAALGRMRRGMRALVRLSEMRFEGRSSRQSAEQGSQVQHSPGCWLVSLCSSKPPRPPALQDGSRRQPRDPRSGSFQFQPPPPHRPSLSEGATVGHRPLGTPLL